MVEYNGFKFDNIKRGFGACNSVVSPEGVEYLFCQLTDGSNRQASVKPAIEYTAIRLDSRGLPRANEIIHQIETGTAKPRDGKQWFSPLNKI